MKKNPNNSIATLKDAQNSTAASQPLPKTKASKEGSVISEGKNNTQTDTTKTRSELSD